MWKANFSWENQISFRKTGKSKFVNSQGQKKQETLDKNNVQKFGRCGDSNFFTYLFIFHR